MSTQSIEQEEEYQDESFVQNEDDDSLDPQIFDQENPLQESQKFLSKINDQINGIIRIKRVCCFKINEKWSMQSQITIACIILFLVIFFLMITLTSFNILQVGKIMQDSQNQLFISQAQKSLKTISKKFERLVYTHFQAVHRDQTHFQNIYKIIYSRPTSDIFVDTPFLQNVSTFVEQFQFSWICYSSFINMNVTQNKQDDQDNQALIKSIQHYNQIYSLLRNQNYTYLATFHSAAVQTQEEIIYYYPCVQVDPNYRFKNKMWYTEMIQLDSNHRQSNEIYYKFHLSQPFISYIDPALRITICRLLVDKFYNLKGVTKSAIDLSRFSRLFSMISTQYTTLLVTQKGNLLISPYFDSTSNERSLSILFTNDTITGFNQDDWQQVTNLAQNKQIVHNCSLNFVQSTSNLLCRWNKVHLRNELIFATYLQHYNYYIVIILDEQNFLESLYAQKQQIEDDLIRISIVFYVSMSLVFFFLLLMVLFIIKILFRPLNNITAYCENINQQDSNKIKKYKSKPIQIEKIVSSGVFNLLTLSFYKLVQKFTGLRINRYYMCHQIEKIQYPRNICQGTMNVEDDINLLNDEDYNINTALIKKCPQLRNLENYQLQQISQNSKEINQMYHQRSIYNKFKKQVDQIKAQIFQSGQPQQENLVKLIFQFYKKF